MSRFHVHNVCAHCAHFATFPWPWRSVRASFSISCPAVSGERPSRALRPHTGFPRTTLASRLVSSCRSRFLGDRRDAIAVRYHLNRSERLAIKFCSDEFAYIEHTSAFPVCASPHRAVHSGPHGEPHSSRSSDDVYRTLRYIDAFWCVRLHLFAKPFSNCDFNF